jgi:hypothetical protein
MGAYTGPLGTNEGTGAEGSGLTAFETWNGGQDLVIGSDFLSTYAGTDAAGAWAPINTPSYWTSAWNLAGMQADFRLSLAVPMIPAYWNGSAWTPAGTLAAGAAGSYDSHFQALATALNNASLGDTYIRLGWEMNGNWFPWAATNATDWINFWRRIANIFHATNANFKMEWNPTLGVGSYDPETLYPGDSYVDVIGLDVYDQGWGTGWEQHSTRWLNSILNESRGLQWHKNFAATHSKPVAFPEWGLATRPDGHGGGDNPSFIQNMYDWFNTFTSGTLAYHSYFDYPSSDIDAEISSNQYPNSASTFKFLFNATTSYGSSRQARVEDFNSMPSGTVLSGSPQPSIVSGKLSVPANATYPAAQLSTSIELISGERAWAEVTNAPATGNQNAQFELVGADTSDQLLMFTDNGTLYARERANNTQIYQQSLATYNATTHRYWAIERQGGNALFRTSPDGTTWTTLATRAVDAGWAWSGMKMEFQAGIYDASSPSPMTVERAGWMEYAPETPPLTVQGQNVSMTRSFTGEPLTLDVASTANRDYVKTMLRELPANMRP